jgi:hypothetical protein
MVLRQLEHFVAVAASGDTGRPFQADDLVGSAEPEFLEKVRLAHVATAEDRSRQGHQRWLPATCDFNHPTVLA